MTLRKLHYAHYYLGLSILSMLLFTCTTLNLEPFKQLTTMYSTAIVVILFTLLTVIQSINDS
ncbi:hypothetical protein SAMN05421858_3782 [Haladaptatus litoreus]|uniref:Uncharacterized protein n=1 Tax=Haladaptatus litoreus TaxID=553468 RepID=A0A1N7DNZ7_9EURY|nr:hypothetical protein SAMN05421858_3782 [Haladaptatus litoreus]